MAITPGASNLLDIVLNRGRRRCVEYVPDILNIDAHSKCLCGKENFNVTRIEASSNVFLVCCIPACVVKVRFLAEKLSIFFSIAPAMNEYQCSLVSVGESTLIQRFTNEF